MPKAEKITARILDEAEKSAAAVLEAARAEAERDLAAAQSQAEDVVRQGARDAINAAVEQKRHKLSAIESELRKEVLSVRRTLLDSVFDKALSKLVALPAETKIEMMAPRIMEASPDGRGELMLTERDAGDLGSRLLTLLGDLYAKAGVKCELAISAQRINASGGFVLKAGNIEYNNTFETLLKAAKDELESKVAALLFAEEQRG